MNESALIAERPSALAAFAKGAMSGAFSGALMMGIVMLVGTVAPLFGVASIAGVSLIGFTTAGFTTAALTTIATSLFGGAMAVKHTLFDAPKLPSAASSTVAIPVGGKGGEVTVMPDLANEPEAAPTKNWAASTGRSEGAQSRIQQILDNGAMNDTDRAAAILAERNNAAATNAVSL